jgi:hypothetical protein
VVSLLLVLPYWSNLVFLCLIGSLLVDRRVKLTLGSVIVAIAIACLSRSVIF